MTMDFSELTDAERAEIRRSHAKATTGLIDKFSVQRTDGRDGVGQPHEGCRYFVLDLDHDEFALPALKAYTAACREKYFRLSWDLDSETRRMEAEQLAGTWPKPKTLPELPR